jgi:uncharacterized protein with PIN domain
MKILQTSEQYKLEKKLKKNLNRCPECGYTGNFGTYHTESKGFFNTKFRHINTVRCFKCGCLYEYADEWY